MNLSTRILSALLLSAASLNAAAAPPPSESGLPTPVAECRLLSSISHAAMTAHQAGMNPVQTAAALEKHYLPRFPHGQEQAKVRMMIRLNAQSIATVPRQKTEAERQTFAENFAALTLMHCTQRLNR